MCHGCVLVGVRQIIFRSLIASQANSGLEAAHSEKCLGLLSEIAQNAHDDNFLCQSQMILLIPFLILFSRKMT